MSCVVDGNVAIHYPQDFADKSYRSGSHDCRQSRHCRAVTSRYEQVKVATGSWSVEAANAAQCPDAPAAPMPVSERTCCATKPARSTPARALLSSTENNQMPTKPMVIENSAGDA